MSPPQRRVVGERPSWERTRDPAPRGAAQMPDPAQQRMPYRPIEQAPEPQGGATGWGQIGLGVLMAGGGTVGTFASYSSASPGGRYTVFYGLIIVGVIAIIKGFASLGNQ